MKHWQTVEFKGSVIIHYEDPDSARRESISCSYQEAWGLLHSLEKLRDLPAFAEREPRPNYAEITDKRNKSSRAVTTIIKYEGDDD